MTLHAMKAKMLQFRALDPFDFLLNLLKDPESFLFGFFLRIMTINMIFKLKNLGFDGIFSRISCGRKRSLVLLS